MPNFSSYKRERERERAQKWLSLTTRKWFVFAKPLQRFGCIVSCQSIALGPHKRSIDLSRPKRPKQPIESLATLANLRAPKGTYKRRRRITGHLYAQTSHRQWAPHPPSYLLPHSRPACWPEAHANQAPLIVLFSPSRLRTSGRKSSAKSSAGRGAGE